MIEAEVPGYDENDIKIYCKNKTLTVSCDKDNRDRKGYIINEISLPSFSRSFTLPEDADDNAVEASSENGILKITIMKKAKTEPKRIEVKIN